MGPEIAAGSMAGPKRVIQGRSWVARRRLAELASEVARQGRLAKAGRWFSRFDAAASLGRRRHFLLFLVDLAVLLQKGNPWGHASSFDKDLATLFAEAPNSLSVASRILHDTMFFKA